MDGFRIAHITVSAILFALILLSLAYLTVVCFSDANHERQEAAQANHVDSTNDSRPRHKKLWWTLIFLTVLGLIVAFTILGDRWFRLNRHLGAQKIVAISHPETITTTPLLQLDYDSTLWSSNSTMDQDSIFHRRVNITQAKFFPTSRLYKHALEAMNKRPQFESSTRLNGSTAFWAPVLKCASANDSVIADATRTWGRGISWKPPSYMSYAAWVPGDWVPGDDANRWSFLPEKTIDDESLDTKRIFILTNSGDTQKTAGKIYDSQILTVNVTECILGNATLTYNFDNASTKVSNWSLPFAYHHHRLTEKTAGELISYTALMNAFGNILVGSTYPGESPDSFPDNPEWKHLNIDWTRAEEVRRGLESFFTNITITLLSDPGFTETVTVGRVLNASSV